MMKMNKWTLGLAAVGLVSIPSVMQAEEKLSPLQTALSSTVISGYISTSMHWNPGTGNNAPAGVAFNGPNKQDGFNRTQRLQIHDVERAASALRRGHRVLQHRHRLGVGGDHL